MADGEAAVCDRCGALLRRAATDSLGFARACATLALLLFLIALGAPLFQLRALGRLSTSSLWSGPDMLRRDGMPALALAVLGALVVAPAARLAIELAVLYGILSPKVPRPVRWAFGCLEALTPWSMVEVFLLGSFVAYTRLTALARVDVGPAAYAMAGVMLCTVAVDATLDREAVWQELDARTPHLEHDEPAAARASSATAAQLIGCHTCGRVSHGAEGDHCGRCGQRLRCRKTDSVARAWAMLLAAVLLYVPANVLPVMSVVRLGRGGPTTILHGVVELAENHLWPLAIVVLLASIVVPIVKLASLAVMLVMAHLRSGAWLAARTKLYRFVQRIGRWSMIDVFMLAILVGVVRLGALANVWPGLGAGAFCAVVVLTMIATEAFDPRLMWDAAGRRDCAIEQEK